MLRLHALSLCLIFTFGALEDLSGFSCKYMDNFPLGRGYDNHGKFIFDTFWRFVILRNILRKFAQILLSDTFLEITP